MENRRASKRPASFSHDGHPPPKRPRGFLINEILGDISEHASTPAFFVENLLREQQIGEGQRASIPHAKPAKEYVKKLNSDSEFHRRFKCLSTKTTFSIEELPDDPEALLMEIFQHCVDAAIDESREHHIKPTNLGCIINSALLDGGPILVPIRQITQDTVSAIFHEFWKVAQSKTRDGITLWGEPFTVGITTIDRCALPTTKRQLRGGARRNRDTVHHRIHDQCLIKIRNPDERNYCLFYALQATMIDKTQKWPRWKFQNYLHNRHAQRGKMLTDAENLIEQIGAPPNLDNYDDETYVPMVLAYWKQTMPEYRFRVFIFDSSGDYSPFSKYGELDYNVPLLLYYDNHHFDGVQKRGGLFGTPYCLACERPYHRNSDHRFNCKARCKLCSRVGPTFPCEVEPGFFEHCNACRKDFRNNDCYQHHIASNFCRASKKCQQCGLIWDVANNSRNGRKGHSCAERFCYTCQNYHDPARGCFISPLEPKKRDHPYRIVAFDVETMQHQHEDAADPSRRKHEINFIAAKIACPACINSGKWKQSLLTGEPCEVCGPHRSITFGHRPFNGMQVDSQVTTETPLEAFVAWILFDLPRKFETYAYSHYGGKFDMVLVFRELYRLGYNPDIIRRGNKMYEMSVRKQKHRNGPLFFRDSFNLMPCSLAALVPSYGLDVEDKPFFPHLSNRPENYGQAIYPTPDDYLANGMMPEKRRQFDAWYEQHRLVPFLLDEELPSYCTNDVEILMAALVAFRKEFMEVSKRQPDEHGNVQRAASHQPHDGIDVLCECMTIASACMKNFRTNHLPTEHLALVPERGYDNAQNQSMIARRFLHWYAKTHGVQMRTASSAGGEKQIGRYSVDGWIEDQQKAVEVHGCAWHACRKCYPNDNEFVPNGKTAGMVRERDEARLEFLRSQVEVEVFWECEIQEMLAADKEMRKIFAEYVDDGPLNIREAFMGGRTGPLKLFHRARDDEIISYFDFTSLYPSVNFDTPYPIGHPTVHVLNDDVVWTNRQHNRYATAILKVFVIPPKKVDVPVLPVKIDDRLCFPLCYACAKEHPEGGYNPNYQCAHGDQERGWVSTCTSLELNESLDEGYVVTKVFRVLEYEQTDDQLFRPYIAEFMSQKIHASGFDGSIRGNADAEATFIKECAEKYGITIDPSKMAVNKGKRSLAKLALNNLWGRFSLRNCGLSQTKITDDPAVFREYLEDKSIDVLSIDMLDRRHMLITYMKKKEFVEEHDCSNIVVSLWTTSVARIRLLKAMQAVVRCPGATLLYTDTDSLIYAHPKDRNPLKTGPHLGEFTDEFPAHRIVEYVSGGAKQYALCLQKHGAGEGDFEHVLKLRGITLNYDVCTNQGMRYENFKAQVLKYACSGEKEPMSILYPNFLRPTIRGGGRVHSCPLRKLYKPFVGKGIVGADYRILDFGHTL